MTVVKFKRNYPSVFDQFFNDFWNEQSNSGSASHLPSTNIWEDDKQFNLDLSAPGFSKEDINVEVADNVMTISGEHKVEREDSKKGYSRKEFSYGSFKRSFTLPENVDEEAINAKYENGILKLSVPKSTKPEVETTKRIQIS